MLLMIQVWHIVRAYLKHAEMVIEPKVQVAANAFIRDGFKGNLPQNLRAQEEAMSYLAGEMLVEGAGC